jgi:hypothetical protein
MGNQTDGRLSFKMPANAPALIHPACAVLQVVA